MCGSACEACRQMHTQAWQWKHLNLTLPPVLVITNPVNATGSTFTRPWLQLQGCGNEPLLAVEYDVTNAAGLFPNQPGFVTAQLFDTNRFDFGTINYFQCYDIPLTNGLNQITLRAWGLGGQHHHHQRGHHAGLFPGHQSTGH